MEEKHIRNAGLRDDYQKIEEFSQGCLVTGRGDCDIGSLPTGGSQHIRLKAQVRRQRAERVMYEPCTLEEQEAYNEELAEKMGNARGYESLVEAIRGAAVGNIPKEVKQTREVSRSRQNSKTQRRRC